MYNTFNTAAVESFVSLIKFLPEHVTRRSRPYPSQMLSLLRSAQHRRAGAVVEWWPPWCLPGLLAALLPQQPCDLTHLDFGKTRGLFLVVL